MNVRLHYEEPQDCRSHGEETCDGSCLERPRTDAAVCTFCQIRDHTGTAADYHPNSRFPSCGEPGCGADYQPTP